MSICRFFWGGSQVYLYESDRGIECCGCHLNECDVTFDEDDPEAIVAHLREHVEAGHVVLPYVFEVFGAEHPDPGPALAARDVWREQHPEYAWMWADDPVAALNERIARDL